MRNRNEAPATILANTEVFDYLKEKSASGNKNRSLLRPVG